MVIYGGVDCVIWEAGFSVAARWKWGCDGDKKSGHHAFCLGPLRVWVNAW